MSTIPSSSSSLVLQPELAASRPPILHVTLDPDAQGGPAAWVATHREALLAVVGEHGSVMVRGLSLTDAAGVRTVFEQVAPLIAETEAFARRRRPAAGVYSSAAWPANQPMCHHHELSYTDAPPGLVLLACLVAPTEGGATGLADAAAVLEALPGDLVDRFEIEGWVLTRTYGGDVGASMADAFGSDDPAVVEAYCAAHDLEQEWLPDGGLRTRQRRPAVVRHPVTGKRCWFNQVAFLSEWTMEPEVRDFLVEEYGADGLPFRTQFGGGDPVGPEVVDLVNAAYDAASVREPWQPGDLMLVDNLRVAHSREPYTGDREVLVGLADPTDLGSLR